ncbi:hypothetical protein RISK_000299 [Rhodopirellula islandica]|uniref:Uncharacterized protein n=2 Tax=Rhodopirellula islandica TaxID=595434 RepID=A0A0J1BMB1_RHOIS|nr:hypothetical protein RISK_000299 [Rhodopirellula islandica]
MGPAFLARGGSPETDDETQETAPDGAGVGLAAWASLTRRVSISAGLEAHRTGREPGIVRRRNGKHLSSLCDLGFVSG